MSEARAAPGLRAVVQALRLHQWSKNVLVWVPPIGAHRLLEPAILKRGALAFVAFGLVASAIYVVNDLRDREADRLHPRKRHRPIARRAIGAPASIALALALLATGFGVAALLPLRFLATLAAYAVAGAAYTMFLKRYVIADVFLLAGLYAARLYGGSFALEIPLSHWLGIFALFVFLSLALLKRSAELVESGASLAGRDYTPADQMALVSMGTTASYIAVLVLALYIVSPEARVFYSRPERLWALCPLVLYFLTRLWILACRGRVADDPIVVALRDPASWAVGALAAAVLWLAT